jgi:hypothetical protein
VAVCFFFSLAYFHHNFVQITTDPPDDCLIVLDTLNQISGALANLIIASSGQLGSIIRLIARIFDATPGFFKNVGFGFGNIPGIIAGSGSREFDRFL